MKTSPPYAYRSAADHLGTHPHFSAGLCGISNKVAGYLVLPRKRVSGSSCQEDNGAAGSDSSASDSAAQANEPGNGNNEDEKIDMNSTTDPFDGRIALNEKRLA